jgi:hypothetical protein
MEVAFELLPVATVILAWVCVCFIQNWGGKFGFELTGKLRLGVGNWQTLSVGIEAYRILNNSL